MKSILVLVISLGLFVQHKERIDWSKIVPLQTTRAEIEARLGAPTFGTGYVLSYDTKDDRVTIWYGGVKQPAKNGCKWELPQNTVLSFVYAPKEKFPLHELNVDLTKFRKERAYEMENDFYYHNSDEGLMLTSRIVDGQEMFLSLTRDPDQTLRQKYCKQP